MGYSQVPDFGRRLLKVRLGRGKEVANNPKPTADGGVNSKFQSVKKSTAALDRKGAALPQRSIAHFPGHSREVLRRRTSLWLVISIPRGMNLFKKGRVRTERQPFRAES